jgi:rare lipoprotein A
MRLKNRLGLILFPFAIAISGCAQAAQDEDLMQAPMPDTPPALADGVQGDQSLYDAVGYASAAGGGDVSFVAASHRSLPVPSYAEVTNLDTGRTILVRIASNDLPSGRVVALSPAAARQLGVEGQDRIPVRVRRTNPPEFERAALRNGQAAGERMATPAALLSALRKKLGTAPATVVAERSTPAAPPAARPPPAKAQAARPGATFGQPQAAPSPSGDRYIVEDARGTGRTAQAPAPVSAAGGGRLFIQIASFSVESRAAALARKVGGSVQPAGSLWRVRMGPYENEPAARAALGQVQAKGYRDARVTR